MNALVHSTLCSKNSSLQLKILMKEFIDDVKSGGIVLGDTLETALELGEKHEAFVTKCKTVSFCSPRFVNVNLSLSLSLDDG